MALVALVAPLPDALEDAETPRHAGHAHDEAGSAGADRPAVAGGHEGSEGVLLGPNGEESVTPGTGCARGAPERAYSIVAIVVEITLNRYLDHDPDGRMYVLEEDLERVRDEEAANRMARAERGEPAVSLGLQGDAIQPLVLRVLPGECLHVELRNDLPPPQAASLHLHGSSLRLAGSGRPATAAEPEAHAQPGEIVEYEWYLPPETPEGTHYFHSETEPRWQTAHGLFGALIVEPPASRWLDPLTGEELRSGWSAIIEDPGGPDFREFATLYHEIGDEAHRLRDRAGGLVPVVDPITSAYRPGSRALNYRSEPFYNRLALQASLGMEPDESLAYSSYAFGDPATPIWRSYVSDPAKQRVVHAGSEVSHVHHLHGGSVRWRRQPDAEPSDFASGLQKHPPLVPTVTERTDSQSIGPSEVFDVANECGSGGCQAGVGDHLYHCHVAHHYFSGMWGIWRVDNTLQDGQASTDSLPILIELPDRAGGAEPAVTSDRLVGRTVEWGDAQTAITSGGLADWVERQLPPAGIPGHNDASVFDWSRVGTRYLGESESDSRWPGYASRRPGVRPPLLFDPRTGKLAYPFLRPHLGARPPFAPGHGPAPFLDPSAGGHEPPDPGANGTAGLCPAGTTRRDVRVEALSIPVPLNREANLLDPDGQLYVLPEDLDRVRGDEAERLPLAIRANAGEECLDVTLTSSIRDRSGANRYSKVGLHIHFVQFDVLASDGLNTGFNYEQTVRPYTEAGVTLGVPTAAGTDGLTLAVTDAFAPGALVGIGLDRPGGLEIRQVVRVDGAWIELDRPLELGHDAGEIVSAEFVRYRWYPDVQFGTAYFHDHVNALSSWRHGLFGALIVEPPGSSYRDPRSGAEIESGLIADIRTAAPVSVDVSGSFRELVMFIQDDTQLNRVGRSSGSAFGLRAEPVDGRARDPTALFDSRLHGDPETPLLEAYVGDPIVIRGLVSATNDVHTWHLDGHWFRVEPWSATSRPVGTVHIGISERFDLVIPRAGGQQGMAGDYLYRNGRTSKLREGSWGIIRVLDPAQEATADLRFLPGRPDRPAASGAVCPDGAPVRSFRIAAVDAQLPMLAGGTGKVLVLEGAAEASGAVQPLVLHANVGDCVAVTLTNRTAEDASLHVSGLSYDPQAAGLRTGHNAGEIVAPGESGQYRFFADPTVGETVALLHDGADVLRNPGLGLYGAIVVSAAGSRVLDPQSGAEISDGSRWDVVVDGPTGRYRDFTLFLQDQDASIGTHRMPYTTRVDGPVGINYRTATAGDIGPSRAAGSSDPATPVLEAFSGEPMRIHVVVPWSEQVQVFSVEGHRWPSEPGLPGTDLLDSQLVGGLEAVTLHIAAAGGEARLPGDYLYGDHRGPYREAGLWGFLRVHPAEDADVSLRPLSPEAETTARPNDGPLIAVLAAAALVGLLGATVVISRIRLVRVSMAALRRRR